MNNLPSATPYMLRNDGTLLTCGSIHPYILMPVKSSLKTDIGTLHNYLDFLDWFYENTLQESVRNYIDLYKETKNPDLLEQLNTLTNNEFCKVRTSNYKVPYGRDNEQIYFRISSSNGFNWFDLIYNVVLQYDNLDYITIIKDPQTFKEVKDFDYYKVKGIEINQLPVEDFLNFHDNPILESITLNEYNKDLKNQSYENTKLKDKLRALAKENNLELIGDDLTVHHLDDSVDATIKKYSNNNPDNILFINTSTIDANVLHQVLHFCKNHYKKGLFSMIRTIKQIFDIPVYSIDSNQKIHKLKFKDVFKKVTEQLQECILMEDKNNQNKLKSNGIYSVLNNEWIKEPVKTDIPDINKEDFDKLFNEWEDKYFELLDNLKSENIQEKLIVKDPRDRRKKIIVPETIETVINSSEFKELYNICDKHSAKTGFARGCDEGYNPKDNRFYFFWTWGSQNDGYFPDKKSISKFYKELGVKNYDVDQSKPEHNFKNLKINGCTVKIEITEGFRIYGISIYDDRLEEFE